MIQIFTRKGGDGRFHAFFSTQFGLDEANSQYYYFKRTKDLLNQTGLEQVYRLGFDGGNERFGYSFGASMGQNTGTLIHNGNDSKRYSMRFGSRVKINKILDYDNSFGFLMQDFRRTRNGNQGLYTGLADHGVQCGQRPALHCCRRHGEELQRRHRRHGRRGVRHLQDIRQRRRAAAIQPYQHQALPDRPHAHAHAV